MSADFWFQQQGGGPDPGLIGNSLRFRGGQRLKASNNSITNTYLFSAWIKRGSLIGVATGGCIYGRGNDNGARFEFESDNLYTRNSSGSTSKSISVYRDPSAWYHIVIKRSTALNVNRLYVWVNGEPVTRSNGNPYLDTPGDLLGNTNIGATGSNTRHFDGYMAEIHAIDGADGDIDGLDYTNFGEYNDDGVWVPIKPNLTQAQYGSAGFYLDFSDPNNIGADRSGNGNNFTPTGFELSNPASPTYDLTLDSPTKNTAVFNPWRALSPDLSSHPFNYSDANMAIRAGGNSDCFDPTTHSFTSGKHYVEFEILKVANANSFGYGVQMTPFSAKNIWLNSTFPPSGGYNRLSAIRTTTSNQTWDAYSAGAPSGATSTSFNPVVGDIIGLGLDMDSGEVRLWRNGTQVGFCPGVKTEYPHQFFFNHSLNNNDAAINAGQRPFKHLPAGYSGAVTSEMAPAVIPNPSEYYNTVTNTGANILNSAIATGGDLFIIKSRTDNQVNQWIDTVRGGTDALRLPGTDGALPYITNPGQCTAYCFKRSPEAGFDIVTWTGTNSNQTISHNCGGVPEFIIVKAYSRPTSTNWACYWTAMNNPAGQRMYPNNANGQTNDSAIWQNRTPTATQLFIGTGGDVNSNGTQYVAYLWRSVPGFSQVGAYTGNGTDRNSYVNCGFQPAFVLIKGTSFGGYNWLFKDTLRKPYNPCDDLYYMSLTNPETGSTTADNIDIYANGFRASSVGSAAANNGGTIGYLAIAAHPFGGSNVSPSPAR